MAIKQIIRQPVTIDMVARRAGVSAATVSRMINNTGQVSVKRRTVIEAAISELNFIPNPLAKSLATGKTLTIGVVTQAIDSPFYVEGLKGIEITLLNNGYIPLFMSGHWNENNEIQCIQQFIYRKVDGIIFFVGMMRDEFLIEFSKQVPLIVTGRNLTAQGIASLCVDDMQGAILGTQHLINLGHKRIAYICGQGHHADATYRLEGYKTTLRKNHINYDHNLVISGNFQYQSGVDAVTKLIKNNIDFSAIFCTNDQTAQGALLALYQHDIKVPNDVSVVGFDNLYSSRYSIPPLTSVNQSIYQMGEIATRAIIDVISGKPPNLAVPEVSLVIRQSTHYASR